MKIALDVMGTDYGPKELVLGAVQAVKEFNCEIVLVGDPVVIKDLLHEYNKTDHLRSNRSCKNGRASFDCGKNQKEFIYCCGNAPFART